MSDQVVIANIALDELLNKSLITKGTYSLYYNKDICRYSEEISSMVYDIMSDCDFISKVKSFINKTTKDVNYNQQWVKYLIEYCLKNDIIIKEYYYDSSYFMEHDLSTTEKDIFNYILLKIKENHNHKYTFNELMYINDLGQYIGEE
jgi:hypothetical protein